LIVWNWVFDDVPAVSNRLVSLVVVAYHRPKQLDALLGGAAGERVQQVVVNVESDREVHAVCERHRAVEVAVADNPGYASAVNLGVAVAQASVVVFSNDDVECPMATVLGLAAVVESGRADVALPRVVASTGKSVRTVQAVPSVWSLFLESAILPDTPVPWLARRFAVQKWREPSAPERVQAASAVAVAVRRDLVVECPLPEAYFMYWEESEWFALLQRRGARVEFRPELWVLHLGGRAVQSAGKSSLLARNAVRCIRRLYGRRAARIAYVITVLWQLRLVVTALARVAAEPSVATRSLLSARLSGLRGGVTSWRETR
jgi:GT2 family glycosyltransferase